MCDSLHLEGFKTAQVEHTCICYGAVVKHKNGWSVAYVQKQWSRLLTYHSAVTPATPVRQEIWRGLLEVPRY